MIRWRRTAIENEIADLKVEQANMRQIYRRLRENAESADPETAAKLKADLKGAIRLYTRYTDRLANLEEQLAAIPRPRILTEAHRQALQRDGYVVIPNVIPARLADNTLSEFQAFNAHATGQQFADEDYNRELELRNIHGIVEYPGGLSHVDFVNRIREHPNVQQVFADIYEVDPARDPIVCGMDRVNYQGSTNMRGLEARSRNAWWHVDQNWNHPEFQCIQGYVDMVGSETRKHAGLQVISNSHSRFEDLALAHAAGVTDGGWDRDWHRMSEEELEYCKMKGGKVVNVKCPKGGMVLWDSRTIHMSRPNRHPDDERFVVYTCGWPRSRLSPQDFARREEARRRRRATSHWPDARHMFPEKPRWFGNHSEEPQAVAEAWINRPMYSQPIGPTGPAAPARRSRSRSRSRPTQRPPTGPAASVRVPPARRSRSRSRSRPTQRPSTGPAASVRVPPARRSRSRSRSRPTQRPSTGPAASVRVPPARRSRSRSRSRDRPTVHRPLGVIHPPPPPPPPKKKTIQLSADEMRRIQSAPRRIQSAPRQTSTSSSSSRQRQTSTSNPRQPRIDVALLSLAELKQLASAFRGTIYAHLTAETINPTTAIFARRALVELFPDQYELKGLYARVPNTARQK